jgi:sucrose-6-phosphate hydrolase SacC (GH32 family)
MQYFVGDFDGTTFTATDDGAWLDHGADFYAAVSYADHPDGAAVIQGWMSNWSYAGEVPATDFRGSMSVARRLRLRSDGVDGRLVLVQEPLVGAPRDPAYELRDAVLSERLEIPGSFPVVRVTLDVEPPAGGRVSLEVRSGPAERTSITVDSPTRSVGIDRRSSGSAPMPAEFFAVHRAPRLRNGSVHLDVIVDLASVEVFADHGEVALTDQILSSPASTGLAIEVEGGPAVLRSLVVRELAGTEQAVEVA